VMIRARLNQLSDYVMNYNTLPRTRTHVSGREKVCSNDRVIDFSTSKRLIVVSNVRSTCDNGRCVWRIIVVLWKQCITVFRVRRIAILFSTDFFVYFYKRIHSIEKRRKLRSLHITHIYMCIFEAYIISSSSSSSNKSMIIWFLFIITRSILSDLYRQKKIK
jgi:hypothetical protein